MTPDQAKAAVAAEYAHLVRRARRGEIAWGGITTLIESRARAAAQHNGVPEMWRNYLPEEDT